MQPKLSVIIASYNHQDYIAETLRSLEEQTFQDFEIIIVDDGSSDKTVEVAKSAQSRAQIFTQENQGVVAARNRGIEKAKGRYLGLDLKEPRVDFCQLAQAMGVPAQKVERPDEISEKLKSALESGKPNLVEVYLADEV